MFPLRPHHCDYVEILSNCLECSTRIIIPGVGAFRSLGIASFARTGEDHILSSLAVRGWGWSASMEMCFFMIRQVHSFLYYIITIGNTMERKEST
jgi:hypothetical protein